MYKYPFVFIFFLLYLVSWSGAAQAQIYRVYRPEPDISLPEEEIVPRDPVIALDYAPVFSKGDFEDLDGNILSSTMAGQRLGLFVLLTSQINIGVEWEAIRNTAHDPTPYISHLKRQAFSLSTKWIGTPYTTPRFYFLTTVGYARQTAKFGLKHLPLKNSTLVVGFGFGIYIPIWKQFYLNGEFRFTQDCHRWRNFLFKGPQFRRSYSAGISYQY